MFAWIALALAALAALGPPVALTGGRPFVAPHAIAFEPHTRQVTNWRAEAVAHLALDWRLTATLAAGRDSSRVSRCVRLNNYWCIKRAGWAGEIAADAEDHVAFASAIEGADVAALLLRRYYIDLKRHSALDIVSRWAPASCGAASHVASRRGTAGGRPSIRPDGLSAHGIGNTLRARFLASRGRHGHRMGAMHRSVVPDRQVTLVRAPTIAVGLGERPIAMAPIGTLSTATFAAIGAGPPIVCSGDMQRIRNYAASAAMGLTPSVHDDLKLFGTDGVPTPHLARLMLNMAAVEIGPLGARQALVEAAVANLAARPLAPTAAAALITGAAEKSPGEAGRRTPLQEPATTRTAP